MIFQFTADATFEAENIDDALAKLAAHFRVLSEQGVDNFTAAPIQFTSGELTVEPAA